MLYEADFDFTFLVSCNKFSSGSKQHSMYHFVGSRHRSTRLTVDWNVYYFQIQFNILLNFFKTLQSCICK